MVVSRQHSKGETANYPWDDKDGNMPNDAKAFDPLQNQLLAALSDGEFKKIEPFLEPVELTRGDILWELEERRPYVYFPTTSLICLMYETEDGGSSAVGIIGRQGLVGMSNFLSDGVAANRGEVETSGVAFRIKPKHVKDEFLQCGDFQEVLLRFIQYQITQISQTAVCNQLHSVDKQLCRWLLMNADHQDALSFQMTQNQIANVLGVRRETISLAAGQLNDMGLIEYSRGVIKIVDRQGLEAAVCQCYWAVVDEHKRLLREYKSTRSKGNSNGNPRR